MSLSNNSREDVQQRPSSRKSKRRWFIWIFKYILLPRLSNLRRRRTEQARLVSHSTVAFPARTRSTQTPAWDQWSTHGFEGQVPGPSTIESHPSYSFRVPFLPEDGHPLHDGLEAENLATGLTPLSSSPSPPSIAIPDSADTTAIETKQTSPLVLDNNKGDISGVSSSPTDTVPVFVHPLRNNNLFQEIAYIIRPDGKKRGVLMMIDTQSRCNLLNLEKWKLLDLKMEPYDRTLYPLQTFSAPIRGIKPYGIAKNVKWHIAGHMNTNFSDFLVVDMRHYDPVLGSSDIIRYDILRPGPGIVRCRRLKFGSGLNESKIPRGKGNMGVSYRSLSRTFLLRLLALPIGTFPVFTFLHSLIVSRQLVFGKHLCWNN